MAPKSCLIKMIAGIVLNCRGKQNKINPNSIRSILINRSDRIGDAVISLPFLLELNKRFSITVLTSEYNDVILKDFLKTQVITRHPLSLDAVIRNMFSRMGYLFHPRNKVSLNPKYDLYLDLIGIRGLDIFLKTYKENTCRYYAGFNMGPWSRFMDYAYEGSVELAKKNIVVGLYELVRDSLGVNLDIPDYLDLTQKMKKPEGFSLGDHYIVVNISGVNKFRGPSPKMYAQSLNKVEFSGKILVIDEPGQPNIAEFKRYNKRPNTVFLNKDLNLWELLYICGKAYLYIGSDLGISHLLQLPTNCIMFFGTGSHTAWRPYSRNSYSQKQDGNMCVEETKNSKGLIKKIIYVPVSCRPCYDIGCKESPCINNIDTLNAANEVLLTLEAILDKHLTR